MTALLRAVFCAPKTGLGVGGNFAFAVSMLNILLAFGGLIKYNNAISNPNRR